MGIVQTLHKFRKRKPVGLLLREEGNISKYYLHLFGSMDVHVIVILHSLPLSERDSANMSQDSIFRFKLLFTICSVYECNFRISLDRLSKTFPRLSAHTTKFKDVE